MSKLIIHASGRKTITNMDGANLVVTKANGKIDEVKEVRVIHGLTDKQIEKAMEKPQEFDEEKYAKEIIKQGRQ